MCISWKENYGSSHSASVKKYEGWLAGDKANTPPFAKETFDTTRVFIKHTRAETGVQKEKRYKTNVFWLTRAPLCDARFVRAVLARYRLYEPGGERLRGREEQGHSSHKRSSQKQPQPQKLALAALGRVLRRKKRNATACRAS